MKKLIFVLSGFLLLTLGSCNKDEINPNENRDLEIRNFDGHCSGDEKSANGNGFGDSTSPSDTTTTITDPNRDEDEDKKIKRRKS